MSGTPELLERQAKTSDDYVSEIVEAQRKHQSATGREKANRQEKQARVKAILSDKRNGFTRLGQSMVGPIQLRLRYQGIVRNVLMEDPLTPGIPAEYDVLDDLGQAYIMHGNEGEVRVSPFEGKKAPVRTFHVTTYPQIKKDDLVYMRVDVVEYAQQQAKEAIMKQEDARLVTLLEGAIDHYGSNPNNTLGGPTVVNELSGSLTPDSLFDLAGIIESRQLQPRRLMFNHVDFRDIHKWNLDQVGWRFKDDVVAGQEVLTFGEFQIGRSNAIPPGTIYMTPEPNFVGVMPLYYSVDVEENHTPAKLHKGWVLDELIGMMILNPRAVGAVRKG